MIVFSYSVVWRCLLLALSPTLQITCTQVRQYPPTSSNQCNTPCKNPLIRLHRCRMGLCSPSICAANTHITLQVQTACKTSMLPYMHALHYALPTVAVCHACAACAALFMISATFPLLVHCSSCCASSCYSDIIHCRPTQTSTSIRLPTITQHSQLTAAPLPRNTINSLAPPLLSRPSLRQH
jgi:hypothetical protein